MIEGMDLSQVVRAIDVARVEGRALVLMKTPPGAFSMPDRSQVQCVTIARALCAEIERKLPGVAAIPVPLGFEVEVRGAGSPT